MKHTFFLFCVLISSQIFGQAKLQTVFEKSDGTSTGTYHEVIEFYYSLAASSDLIQVKEMGLTDSGLPLHLVILDVEKDFDFNVSRKKGKTHLLINNGIHPGEPDGISASQMLIRDYISNEKLRQELKDIVVAVIPIYNIGGALNRNSHSRVNQNGPQAYGFRGNARNYDLNRDFIKADSKNTRSFYEIFHTVRPEIFIDTHVSNGADYQYNITHLATQHNKLGGEMGRFIENTFTPELEKRMKEKGNEITPYVNVFNSTPDEKGITQFMDYPRYSTGFTALFNTLGFMIETHMLKSFAKRVEATYDFLESVIEIALESGKTINQLHSGFSLQAGELLTVRWTLDINKYREIDFKGYEGRMLESEVTGEQRLFYDREKPFTKKIPYYNTYTSEKEVVVPKAYIIPQGWHETIEILKLNTLKFSRFAKDTALNVECYKIKKFETYNSVYEGHYPHYNTAVNAEKRIIHFRKGDYIFYTDQYGGRYLVETLEPEAYDSFFNWNYFDTILQQKEHFSPYVFEDIARLLLMDHPDLKEALEKEKAGNAEFAKDWYAQLEFIYRHSPYYEEAHLQYPVYRLVD